MIPRRAALPVVVLIGLATSSCATVGKPDYCAHAAVRRGVYTHTIAAADTLTAMGRDLPPSMIAGREAAALALAILDRRCPAMETAR